MNILYYIRGQKRYIALLVTLALVNAFLSFIIPFAVRSLLSKVDSSRIPSNWFFIFGALLPCIYLFRIAQGLWSLRFSFVFKCRVIRDLFEKYFKMRLSAIEQYGPTYYAERILNATETLFGLVGNSLAEALVSLISIAVALCISFSISPLIFAIFVLLIPLNLLSYRKLNIKLQKKCVQLQEASATCLKNVLSIARNIESIKQFPNVSVFTGMLSGYIEKWQRETIQLNRFAMLISSTITMLTELLRYGLLLVTVNYLLAGKLTVADLVFVNLVFSIYFNAIVRLNNLNINLRDVKASLNFINENIITGAEAETGNEELSSINTISINLSGFSYSPNRQLLRDVKFEIKQGERIGIAGETGTGKTTLAKLLTRLYDCVDGIMINSKPISSYSLSSLRRQIYLVSQIPAMFPGSVKDNVTLGLEKVDENRLRCLEKLEFFSRMLKDLPDGWDTEVGEGGFNLSGGQKQIIMIARMLMHDPSVVIFDESTSSMDSGWEEQIDLEIKPFMHKRIVIKISHRLSTLLDCDRIVFMRNGHAVAIGSHTQLLDACQEYRDLFGQQINASSKE